MANDARTSTLPDAAALARERSMLMGAISDMAMGAVFLIVSVWSNSLMMLAESARAMLLLALEIVLLVLLRRIQRGRTHDFDYGAGKLEQFANAGIGTAMGIAGLSVAIAAAYRWWHPPEQHGLAMIFAVVMCAANLVQNGLVFRALWRVGRDGRSLILTGQVRTRLAKLVSSGIVLLALTVNVLAGSGLVGRVAEAAGAGFVAFVMLQLAVSMWRHALPSLLDRTLEEGQQLLINRVLVNHFDDYDELHAVRSRLSGNTAFVEIELGFQGARSLAEVQVAVDRVRAEIERLIPGAGVTVTPVAVG